MQHDCVIIKDLLRGEWKIGRVKKTIKSRDGKVQKVEVMHPGIVDRKQKRKAIERPVQNLVFIVPWSHSSMQTWEEAMKLTIHS